MEPPLQEGATMIESAIVKFSSKRRSNLLKLQGDDTPCFICGKAVRTQRYWARFSDGGLAIASDEYADRPENIGGDMGCYPVGPECYRRLPDEVKMLVKRFEDD